MSGRNWMTEFNTVGAVAAFQTVTQGRMRGRIVNAASPFRRLLQGNLTERFGRFYTVRQAYSRYRNWRQGDRPTPAPWLRALPQTLFPNINPALATEQLRQLSIAFGLTLPREMTAAIYTYACTAACIEPGYSDLFGIEDIRNGFLGKGIDRPVHRALVTNLRNCGEIDCLVRDPGLLQLVRSYLRYWPDRITTHLTWSIASDRSLPEIQQHYPPANFHYDVAGYNFMTVYFYITPVTALEYGPHMMICGSHGPKPMALIWSGRYSDACIDRYYGLEKAVPIFGEAGFGFSQDPSCIHRVLPPKSHHRLLLQIRYS